MIDSCNRSTMAKAFNLVLSLSVLWNLRLSWFPWLEHGYWLWSYLSWPQTHNSPRYFSNIQSRSYKQMKTSRKAGFFPPVISGRYRLSLKYLLNTYQGNLKIKIRKIKEPRYKLRQSSVESCPSPPQWSCPILNM